ncbi:MAG: T9SS type A sorting domain-containing protein [Ignavibacteria bacterium]|nr:T9SS type A sorting domain-containing protein [Ignavibacteria bacterium]
MRSVLMFVMIAALSLGAMPLAYAQPRLVTPPNATLVADSLIRLRWKPLSDASRYEVAIGWDSLFTLPTVQTLSATQNTITIRRTSLPYVPAELTAFWRVRARLDSMNVGAWSEVWRFTMPVPKTVPPIVTNQIQDKALLIPTGQTPTEDRIELESPQWRNDFGGVNSVFFNFNNVAIGVSQNTISLQTGMKYSAESENQSVVAVRVKNLDSTLIQGNVNPRPTLYYGLNKTSNLCQSILCTVIATDNLGWSVPCFFLVQPRTSVFGMSVPQAEGISLEQRQFQGVKLTFGQMSIARSTIASVPILTSSTATSGWLSLSAVSGVEYSLSSTGTWQPSLRAEWRSGQPKLERLWLRYTPQSIGQNFPIIRYVANDSCASRSHGLLRLEALATQPVPYAYTITSVRDAQALEPLLEAVYPNPTSGDVTFALSLSKASRVKLTVCTTLGSILQTVSDAPFPAGRHSMTWQSMGLPSGVYGYRLEVDGASVQSGFVNVVR